MRERLGRPMLIVAGSILLAVAIAWLALGRGKPVATTTDINRIAAKPHESTLEDARVSGVLPARERPRLPEPEEPGEEAAADHMRDGFVPAPDSDAIAAAWSVVDLDELQKALPGNLYFQLSSPTNDPDTIAERKAERERWNVEYGKILSGTGTEEEIRDYYDHRAQLSTDYVELTTHLLDHYQDDLPERDVGLLQLARRLHLARLEEIPRKVEEAFQRKREQDAVREAWLADEAKFGDTSRRDD